MTSPAAHQAGRPEEMTPAGEWAAGAALAAWVTCVACAAPLRRQPFRQPIGQPIAPQIHPPAAPDPFPCCDAVRCRMLVARRGDLGDAGLRHLLQVQARQATEQKQIEAGQQARRDREQRENTACQAALLPALQARLAALPQPVAPALLHVVLPSGPRRQRALSKHRRERYQRHLQWVLAGLATLSGDKPAAAQDSVTTAPGAANPPSPASGPPWAGSLCGVCRGGCCTQGGDTAYLGSKTLQRVMQQQPQMGAEAVLAHYLAHLPAQSMAGSCIHHTAQGCSLPREMRSDTCNDFLCGPAALLQAPDQAVDAVVVIQRRQSLWRLDDLALDNSITRATLLSADGMVALRPGVPRPGRD